MAVKDVLGRFGEDVAADHLQKAGLVVLERNWRCREGELDIVALERRVLVICEVKTRSGLRYGSPLEAVSHRKRVRLRRLAATWLAVQGLHFDEIRIDVIGLVGDGAGEFSLEHVRGVG